MFLLGVYAPESTTEHRSVAKAAAVAEYRQLRQQWESIGELQAARFAKWREVSVDNCEPVERRVNFVRISDRFSP